MKIIQALPILLWVAGAAAAQPPTATTAEDEVDRGRILYTIHCLDCHGPTGTGGGPKAATLRKHPADLTLLARNNEGTFPEEAVTRTIDGRDVVEVHGTRDMPVWGMTFVDRERDVQQEAEVQAQIRALVRYIASLQEP